MDYGLYYHYSGYTFPHIAERKKRDTFAWYDTNNKTVMEEIMQLDNVSSTTNCCTAKRFIRSSMS